MNPTEYKLYLGDWWDDCPTIWRNFINDLRSQQSHDSLGHISAKDINKALEFYHAHCIVNEIYFAEEKYKNWFLLQWS